MRVGRSLIGDVETQVSEWNSGAGRLWCRSGAPRGSTERGWNVFGPRELCGWVLCDDRGGRFARSEPGPGSVRRRVRVDRQAPLCGWSKREAAKAANDHEAKVRAGAWRDPAAGRVSFGEATKRRGRGKRAGRSRNRGPEKVVTDALGMLLVAERTALLSGRDDEFVALLLKAYTCMRWGEIVGLETEFVRTDVVRVEWQLYELDTGELRKCPPKDDSYRSIDIPLWLSGLVAAHMVSSGLESCPCHGHTYVFRGHGSASGMPRGSGAKLVDVARRAGVSSGTVSNVLNRPATVVAGTRARVEGAIEELGYVRGGRSAGTAPHWRRSGFSTWLFQPAATGWYPKKAPHEAHPVPVMAEPWPGVPARGRNASARAEACWTPIVQGLTPHGLRHSHKTVMEEPGTPPKLMDERMGHEDGSVQARYSHVTPKMGRRLLEGLTEQWEESLEARLAMSRRSPVAALDALLRERHR